MQLSVKMDNHALGTFEGKKGKAAKKGKATLL